MEQLTASNIVKRFGDHTVLADFHLSVKKGEFTALLGPSGCGKSTLLRIVAGLETPDHGTVTIAGRDVSALPPEDRNVALMFQSYALLPHMSVLENVRFPLRMRSRTPRAEQAEKSRAALAMVKLDHLETRYPRQLSGGQQQRVALARAIVAEPDLLLLDEPLSNLDARLREDMQIELKRLHRDLGLTTIFVTHDQSEALGLADQVVLMNGGRIEQQDTPEDIYRRPVTAFAADFLGGANIIELTIAGDADGKVGRFPGGDQVPLAIPDGAAGPRKFMLRKEAVTFAPAEPMVSVAGTLVARNYLGSQTRSVVSVGGMEIIAMTESGTAGREGETVRIGWRKEDLMLLSDR